MRLLLTFFLAASALAQPQVADPMFVTTVANPAYTSAGPRVLFDEAHLNFHTADGRYKPFADLLTSDGYTITRNSRRFTDDVLRGYDVLVIANAMGRDRSGSFSARRSAFTRSECLAVARWVKSGGSLLLIADHAPMGAAAARLARRFKVDMSKGYTADPRRQLDGTYASMIVYTRDAGLIDHAITNGRDDAERIQRVIAFTGQSLSIPPQGEVILRLGDSAVDVTLPDTDNQQVLETAVRAARRGEAVAGGARSGASGRAQLLALPFGKGRVVVSAEAAMLSAQLVSGDAAQELGTSQFPMGMNHPDCDNRQLALNIMHWLTRLL